MREQLASASEVLAALGDHVLGSGGKRMRPALLLLAAELCGYTGPAPDPRRRGGRAAAHGDAAARRRRRSLRAAPRPAVRECALGQSPRRARGRLLLRARLVADRGGRRSRHPVDLRRHDPQHGRGRAAPAPAQLRSVGHRGALLPGDRAQERGAAVRGLRVGLDPRRRHARRAAPARRVRARARSRVPAARRRARLRRSRGRPRQAPVRRPARGQGDAAAAARAQALHGGRARGGGVAVEGGVARRARGRGRARPRSRDRSRAALPRRRGHRAPRRRARAPRAHRDRSLPRWRRPERPARRCRVRRPRDR